MLCIFPLYPVSTLDGCTHLKAIVFQNHLLAIYDKLVLVAEIDLLLGDGKFSALTGDNSYILAKNFSVFPKTKLAWISPRFSFRGDYDLRRILS